MTDKRPNDAQGARRSGYLADTNSRMPRSPAKTQTRTVTAALIAAALACLLLVLPIPPAPVTDAADDEMQGEDLPEPVPSEESAQKSGGSWLKSLGLVLLGAFLAAVVGMAVQRRLLLGR